MSRLHMSLKEFQNLKVTSHQPAVTEVHIAGGRPDLKKVATLYPNIELIQITDASADDVQRLVADCPKLRVIVLRYVKSMLAADVPVLAESLPAGIDFSADFSDGVRSVNSFKRGVGWRRLFDQ